MFRQCLQEKRGLTWTTVTNDAIEIANIGENEAVIRKINEEGLKFKLFYSMNSKV